MVDKTGDKKEKFAIFTTVTHKNSTYIYYICINKSH